MRGLWVIAAACAGISCAAPAFEGGVYRDGDHRYRVGAPGPGWRFQELDRGEVVFVSPGLGTIAANSTCQEYEDVPPQALLNHLLFGLTERRYRLEETVAIAGRGALHAIIDAELDGVPLTLEVYVLPKDGCVYDLSLVSSPDAHPRAQAAFRSFVDGFLVLERGHG